MKTDTADKLLHYIEEHAQARPSELAQFLHISPQALFRQLHKLVSIGTLVKLGSAPKVFYALPLAGDNSFADNNKCGFMHF